MSTPIDRITDYLFEIPQTGKMRVPARIYATANMLPDILKDRAAEQAAQVAWLPGIVGYSYAMPDIHWGYGFPIGGVAAFDMDKGIISPGGVGYDINCGVRLLRTGLQRSEIESRLRPAVEALFRAIPSGVGSTGKLKLNEKEEKRVLENGALWAVRNGYGGEEDLDKIEENGRMAGADPDQISARARERGRSQLGTLGSGNHFIELGVVDEIYDPRAAAAMGLRLDQITLFIHTGSRGLGHQVCDDAIKEMLHAAQKYGIELPDRQLCCAPISSPEGQRYLAAMSAAVNFAFANRQMITHWAREALMQAWSISPRDLDLQVVYEVAHNIAKVERHTVAGVERPLCVHRKGATRAFGPHHPEIPAAYREIGQPVLIPGDMGRCSYLLTGTTRAMSDSFGSACHGAGRVMSRTQAVKSARGRSVVRELAERGILVRAESSETIAEEIPEAYKNVTQVVDAVAGAGLACKVAKLKPLGVIKG
ncbi:MAG TPA: RtcB family protein [bacterium]|nr:RtcB family protein [bacterium]HOY44034.1 RtcB family protein [bacterium]HPG82278.1 RtcB family protein [bacterium]HPM58135.1 RtcB family protein [bacterium]